MFVLGIRTDIIVFPVSWVESPAAYLTIDSKIYARERPASTMEFLVFQVLFVTFMATLLLTSIRVSYLIYRDAKQRGVPGSYPLYWALGVLVIPFIILPLYLYYSPRLGSRSRSLANGDLAVIWVYTTLLTSLIVGTWLSPPDPFSNIIFQTALLIPFGLLFYYLIVIDRGTLVYRYIPDASHDGSVQRD